VTTRTCAVNYLAPQVDLFSDRVIIALGAKARDRMKAAGLAFHEVGHVAPPAGNYKSVRKSWKVMADLLVSK